MAAYPKGPSTQLSYPLKNSNLHNYYPKPEYLIIGSFGPLGEGYWAVQGSGFPVTGSGCQAEGLKVLRALGFGVY